MHFSHCWLRLCQMQTNISSLNLEQTFHQTDIQPYPFISKISPRAIPAKLWTATLNHVCWPRILHVNINTLTSNCHDWPSQRQASATCLCLMESQNILFYLMSIYTCILLQKWNYLFFNNIKNIFIRGFVAAASVKER